MLQKTFISLLVLTLAGVMSVALGPEASAQAVETPTGKGLAAIDSATKANRYLFIFFYRQQDPQTLSLRDIFNSAVTETAGRADSIAILITDPSEAGIVKSFGVGEAPMPLVLVRAPNGAVTGGFPSKFTKQQLLEAFATPAMEKLLGALQQGKLVLLCIQNGRTRSNVEAMNGVRAFKEDPLYSSAIEVLVLDPNSAEEGPFLAKLRINTPIDEATTLLVAPPASIIGSFKGATDKNQLIATLTKALSSCGTGCQAGGCGVGN